MMDTIKRAKGKDNKIKNKIIISLFIVSLLFFIYFFTWLAFFCDKGIPTGSGLHKSDWLAFWGAFLSFIGSTILGGIAVWQTKRANKIAEEAHKLSQKMLDMDLEKNFPYVIVSRSDIFKKESPQINVEILKKERYRVSSEYPLSAENQNKKVSVLTFFLYNDKESLNNRKEFFIDISLQNKSETIIQSIEVKKMVANLFTSSKSQKFEYEIKKGFGLNECNAIMPGGEMLFKIEIASNYEDLNQTIFQHPTSFKIIIKVNTISNSYLEEISLVWFSKLVETEYKFNYKESSDSSGHEK